MIVLYAYSSTFNKTSCAITNISLRSPVENYEGGGDHLPTALDVCLSIPVPKFQPYRSAQFNGSFEKRSK